MILLADRTNPCPHTLAPGGLVCDRTDPHDAAAVGGHTYTPSGGGMDAEGEQS